MEHVPIVKGWANIVKNANFVFLYPGRMIDVRNVRGITIIVINAKHTTPSLTGREEYVPIVKGKADIVQNANYVVQSPGRMKNVQNVRRSTYIVKKAK
ncbi:hypothetical protein ACFL35_18205 [Candidatus Riflebacteria bacterium]